MQSADFSRVLREFARDGYELMTGDAFAAEDVDRAASPRNFPMSPSCSAPATGRPSRISASSTTGSTSRPICPA